MPEPNLCRHCFCAMEEGETVCPVCGKKPEAENPEQALPPGTVLSGRYRIGTVLHHNDLLTTYLGWDTEKDRKVQVEEFFPGILNHQSPRLICCKNIKCKFHLHPILRYHIL